VVVLDEQVWTQDVVMGTPEIVSPKVAIYTAALPDAEIPERLDQLGESGVYLRLAGRRGR
jgi:hypothetical protein